MERGKYGEIYIENWWSEKQTMIPANYAKDEEDAIAWIRKHFKYDKQRMFHLIKQCRKLFLIEKSRDERDKKIREQMQDVFETINSFINGLKSDAKKEGKTHLIISKKTFRRWLKELGFELSSINAGKMMKRICDYQKGELRRNTMKIPVAEVAT